MRTKRIGLICGLVVAGTVALILMGATSDIPPVQTSPIWVLGSPVGRDDGPPGLFEIDAITGKWYRKTNAIGDKSGWLEVGLGGSGGGGDTLWTNVSGVIQPIVQTNTLSVSTIASGNTNQWKLGGVTNGDPHVNVDGTDYALQSSSAVDGSISIFTETFAASSSLTNFIVHGSAAASVSGGKMNLSGFSADADYISRSNYVTSLEDWQMTVVLDVPASRPATCYVFPSVYGSYAGYATKCGINLGTAQSGQLAVLDGNDNFLVASDSVSATNNLNISASDRIKFICERHKDVISVYAVDLNSNDARSISYRYTNVATNFVHSLGVWAIAGNFGGATVPIEDWNISSDTGTADIICIGDSITTGYAGSVSTDNRWADILAMNSKLKVAVLAGPNNALKDMLVLTNEINYYHPKIGLISAGINDLNQGRTTNQLQGDIGTMVTNLLAIGVTPVVITPTPYHGGTSLRSIRDWITSAYPANSIDTFTPMCGGTNGTYLQPLVDAGDGAHFNVQGHRAYGMIVTRGLRDLGLIPRK